MCAGLHGVFVSFLRPAFRPELGGKQSRCVFLSNKCKYLFVRVVYVLVDESK